MAPRIPGSLILVFGLLALGAAGAAASLGVQRWQTQERAEAAAREMTGGEAGRGKLAFARRRCGACHSLLAVDGADGQVGPALDKVARRAFLAGDQPNDPTHMIAWVQHPQAMRPGVGMPELGLGDQEARDLAAYMYTLR
jgi:cytochrome c2